MGYGYESTELPDGLVTEEVDGDPECTDWREEGRRWTRPSPLGARSAAAFDVSSGEDRDIAIAGGAEPATHAG